MQGKVRGRVGRYKPGGHTVCRESCPGQCRPLGGGRAQSWAVLFWGFRPAHDVAWPSWLVAMGLLELVSRHRALGWEVSPSVTT